MSKGPDRRRAERFGLYRTVEAVPSAAVVARAIAGLPRAFDQAAIERALLAPADEPIVVRNSKLDLRIIREHIEAAGIPLMERTVPDRRLQARAKTLSDRLKNIFQRT